MIQLNLLPDLKKEFVKSQKNKAFVMSMSLLVTIGAIGLSALLFVYVNFIQTVQVNLATDDIKQKTATLKKVQDIDKYLTIQNQLSSIPQLHDAKGAYSRLFTFLNVLNPSPPNNINLNNLQVVEGEKSITFTGTTATFQTLNVFVDTLKNAEVSYKAPGATDPVSDKMFPQVLVQSSGLSKQSGANVVTFTVKAVYNDPVFDVRNTEVVAKVPNIITTSSVTGSPTLFNGAGGGQ